MTCRWCHSEFVQTTKWQLFCSSRCKQRSYRHPCAKCGKPIVLKAVTCQKCKTPSRIRDERHFWSLVDKTESCWIWNGPKGKGYGRVTVNGIRDTAARQSWRLTKGEIGNLLVCHHCDVPLCVRPDHLFLGTQKDNMQDWTRKGKNKLVSDPSYRQVGDKNWMRTTRSDSFRKRISINLKNEILSGKRIVLRDPVTGQVRGTKCA